MKISMISFQYNLAKKHYLNTKGYLVPTKMWLHHYYHKYKSQ